MLSPRPSTAIFKQGLQGGCTQLTLATHHGSRSTTTRSLPMSSLPRDLYRPFAAGSYNKNIGTLVEAKQCLVLKLPNTHQAHAPRAANNLHPAILNTHTIASSCNGQRRTEQYETHYRWPPRRMEPSREQGGLYTSRSCNAS